MIGLNIEIKLSKPTGIFDIIKKRPANMKYKRTGISCKKIPWQNSIEFDIPLK